MTAGGARAGAGRRAGSLSRQNSEVIAVAMAEGTTPVAYLLGIMRDQNAEEKRRDWAAEKAAPYLHARPSPLDRTVRLEGMPSTATIQGIDHALDRIIAAVAAEELSPGEGQSLVSVIEARRKAIETSEIMQRLEKLEQQAEGGSR
jgi:hypothetical protein